MRVGFTGTRQGMTVAQFKSLQGFLEALTRRYGEGWLHHGDCVGADAQAHDIACGLSWNTVAHPPVRDTYRAFKTATESRPPQDYLVRNQDIVREVEILLAAPQTSKEEVRSGTWATIRRARRAEKTCFIFYPNGSVE